MMRFRQGDVAALARREIERRGTSVDDAVENALDFAAGGSSSRARRRSSPQTASPTTSSAVVHESPMSACSRPNSRTCSSPFRYVLEQYGLPTPVTPQLDVSMMPLRFNGRDLLGGAPWSRWLGRAPLAASGGLAVPPGPGGTAWTMLSPVASRVV